MITETKSWIGFLEAVSLSRELGWLHRGPPNITKTVWAELLGIVPFCSWCVAGRLPKKT